MGLFVAGALGFLQSIDRHLAAIRKDQVTLNSNLLLVLEELRKPGDRGPAPVPLPATQHVWEPRQEVLVLTGPHEGKQGRVVWLYGRAGEQPHTASVALLDGNSATIPVKYLHPTGRTL